LHGSFKGFQKFEKISFFLTIFRHYLKQSRVALRGNRKAPVEIFRLESARIHQQKAQGIKLHFRLSGLLHQSLNDKREVFRCEIIHARSLPVAALDWTVDLPPCSSRLRSRGSSRLLWRHLRTFLDNRRQRVAREPLPSAPLLLTIPPKATRKTRFFGAPEASQSRAKQSKSRSPWYYPRFGCNTTTGFPCNLQGLTPRKRELKSTRTHPGRKQPRTNDRTVGYESGYCEPVPIDTPVAPWRIRTDGSVNHAARCTRRSFR
jgi:hypothetical protein